MSDSYRSGVKPLGRKEYELYYMCCITQLTVRKVTNMLILTIGLYVFSVTSSNTLQCRIL